MRRIILLLFLAGMGCIAVGVSTLAQNVGRSSLPAQEAFFLTSLDDIKERVQELRGEIALLLIDPELTRLQRAQLRGIYRKTRSLLRTIARAETAQAQGHSIDTLLMLIQNQLDAIEELLLSLQSSLTPFSARIAPLAGPPIPLGIVVYDLRGHRVKTIMNVMPLPLDIAKQLTEGLANGVYLYKYMGGGYKLRKLFVNH